jgi:hypothetical protein
MLVSQINIPFASSMTTYKRGKPGTQTFSNTVEISPLLRNYTISINGLNTSSEVAAEKICNMCNNIL